LSQSKKSKVLSAKGRAILNKGSGLASVVSLRTKEDESSTKTGTQSEVRRSLAVLSAPSPDEELEAEVEAEPEVTDVKVS
jgi:hypothetical protein